MPDLWSRRHLLGAGVGLLLVGCQGRQRGGSTARLVPSHPSPPAAPLVRPAPAVLRYRVQAGDTLSSIARRSGSSVGEIVEANRLTSNLIKPGQTLMIPGADHLGPDPYAHLLEQRRTAADHPRLARVDRGDFRLRDRSSWARHGIKSNHVDMQGVRRITLHHTGEHAGMRGLSDIEIIQRIDRYHREGRKWSAIGYHFLIGSDGTVYEGRPAGIQGAHVSGENPHNLGISCIGDFNKHLPPRRQLAAVQAFLDDRRRAYRVPLKRIYGHRDLGPTVCPGAKLYGWLQSYKRSA